MPPFFVKRSTVSVTGQVALLVAAIGFIASIVQISASFGWLGVLLSVLTITALVVYLSQLVWPLLRRNTRGIRLIDAITTQGLEDIERRGAGRNDLPPVDYFQQAQTEIAIMGTSLYGTIERHLRELKIALSRGIKIRLMLLDPMCQSVQERSTRVDLARQIELTLDMIVRERLTANRGLAIRFMNALPPFLGILVDGDIDPSGDRPLDKHGWIRVQVNLVTMSAHDGIVLQFRRTNDETGAFTLFAQDLRRCWHFAKEKPELLERIL